MKTILVIFALIAPVFCCAQTDLSGIVKTKKTNQPVEDCHVYINKQLGTVTDENGVFNLKIPEQNAGAELHVSHVAYKPFVLPVAAFKNNRIIILEEAVFLLDEIVIRPDPWLMFQDRVEVIISTSNDKSDDYIYYAILNELEDLKPLFEELINTEEKRNYNR